MAFIVTHSNVNLITVMSMSNCTRKINCLYSRESCQICCYFGFISNKSFITTFFLTEVLAASNVKFTETAVSDRIKMHLHRKSDRCMEEEKED